MELLTLPVSQLRPAPYNPRVALRPGDEAFARLSRSLREFGLVQPLVWNRRTGHLVAGHQRLEILRREGRLEVECVVVDLPLEREQALNVALNNAALSSDWQPDLLASLITELQSLPDFDATLTGFSAEDLHELLLQPDPEFVPEESDREEADLLRATLDVPRDDWPRVEVRLNALLAEVPSVRLHLPWSANEC